MPNDPQVRSLRLEAQDTALSRLERGFESPRERHKSKTYMPLTRESIVIWLFRAPVVSACEASIVSGLSNLAQEMK